MILKTLFVAFGIFSVVHGSISTANFSTVLDHYRTDNFTNVTFPFEYNVDFYQPGGPLFFFVNDGLTYTNEWINRGLLVDIARSLRGALFTTDHRFFRFNVPTNSVTLENLQYLNIEQNLADLNLLINHVKKELKAPRAKVFLWGAGYGGTLAAIAKQKFLTTVNGVWSSNGFFQPLIFNENYYEQLAKNIREVGGDKCSQQLNQTFQTIERQLQSQNDSQLVQEFSICRPWNISNEQDVGLFIEGLLSFIDKTVEKEQRAGILKLCSALDAIDADPLRSLARWIRFESGGDLFKCFNYNYEGKIKWLSDTQLNNPGTSTGLRQWAYLQCTQVGQFKTLVEGGLFGYRLNEAFYYNLCKDSFGPEYTFENIFKTVELFDWEYGGKNPAIENALFTNGNLSSIWNEAITEYRGRFSQVINIAHVAGSAEFESISTSDSTALYLAKRQIITYINRWARRR